MVPSSCYGKSPEILFGFVHVGRPLAEIDYDWGKTLSEEYSYSRGEKIVMFRHIRRVDSFREMDEKEWRKSMEDEDEDEVYKSCGSIGCNLYYVTKPPSVWGRQHTVCAVCAVQ